MIAAEHKRRGSGPDGRNDSIQEDEVLAVAAAALCLDATYAWIENEDDWSSNLAYETDSNRLHQLVPVPINS